MSGRLAFASSFVLHVIAVTGSTGAALDNAFYARRSRSSLPPWGSRTVHTDPGEIPDTNITRYYDLTIARCSLAPDGVQKDMICVNGQFPGPTLTADWGDKFEVTVHNRLTDPEDGTAIHWHG